MAVCGLLLAHRGQQESTRVPVFIERNKKGVIQWGLNALRHVGEIFLRKVTFSKQDLKTHLAVLGGIHENWKEAFGPRKKKLEGQMGLT